MSQFENKNDIINIINENTEYQTFKNKYKLNDNEIMTELIAKALMDDNKNVNLAEKNINRQIEPYIRFLNTQNSDNINEFVTLLSDNKENIDAYSKILQTQSKAYDNVSVNITVSDTPGSVGPGDKLKGPYKSGQANRKFRERQRAASILQKQLNNGGKKRLRNATKKKRNLRKKKHTRRKKRKTRRN